MFTLPIFNLTANIWRPPAVPPTDPSYQYDAQLYFPSRGIFDVTPNDLTLWVPPIYLRVPMGSDVQVGDAVEVSAGDGWFYLVRFVERTHRGFQNEYLSCVLEQTDTPLGGGGLAAGHLNLEDGSHLLLEDGGRILQGG